MNNVRSALIMLCGALLLLYSVPADAYSDYVHRIDMAALRESASLPEPVQTEIDMTLVQVQRSARADIASAPDRQIRSGPAILLTLGLCMSGLALWGRKRHQTA